MPMRRPLDRRVGLGGAAYRLREARREDAADVVALFRAVLEEGRYFITEPGEYRGRAGEEARVILRYAGRDDGLYLVARREADGGLAGVCTVRAGHLRRTRHVGRLEVFVARQDRGRGLGRALLEAAVDWAEANPGMRKLSLAVFEDNARAVALYRSLGFEVEGRRVGEYQEADGRLRDDLIMARSVERRPRGEAAWGEGGG